jgi:glycerophosphoryl diester phosphodiesterase
MRRISTCALLLVLAFESRGAQGQLIIAHRGASYDAPENTLAAFRLGYEQGADGVEGDFYLSSDGHVVCIHDRDTERVAGVKHVVKDTPFAVLRSLDVGAWKNSKYQGEQMPTLEEALATVPKGKIFFIELKVGPEIIAPMLKVLDEMKFPREQTVVISFNEPTIAECEKQRPELKTYLLVGYEQNKQSGKWEPTEDQVHEALERSGADGLGAEGETAVVDRAFLKELCDEGFCDFSVWTIDQPKVARFYKDLDAKAITTNRPGWLRAQLAKDRAAVPAAANR